MKPNIEATALGLLARREHSTHELRRKLHDKGFPDSEIDGALQRLARDKLLSDERYIESFIRARISKGYGPLLIQAQLQERGIARALAQECVAARAPHWLDDARRAQRKRFGAAPTDYQQRARQMRFLQQRGFTSEHINAAIRNDDDELQRADVNDEQC